MTGRPVSQEPRHLVEGTDANRLVCPILRGRRVGGQRAGRPRQGPDNLCHLQRFPSAGLPGPIPEARGFPATTGARSEWDGMMIRANDSW